MKPLPMFYSTIKHRYQCIISEIKPVSGENRHIVRGCEDWG